jgi:hypothetical protein
VTPRKLTPGEISSTVEKIRKRYGDYITRYFKRKSLLEAFERRYIKALRGSVDISSFLLAEISAIEELTGREEERIQADPEADTADEEPSFADRIVEENRRRIFSYPDFPFHDDAGEEVRRLVGALSDLERVRWADIGVALRNTMYAMTSTEMLTLDSQLRTLSTTSMTEPPAFLARLMSQLRKFPRSYPAIEREEKEYILEAAFFLNDLLSVLERVKRVYTDMPAAERKILEESFTYVEEVIGDFRLKDLKRRRRWDRDEG